MINELKITPLGGVGETGALNCMVYESEKEAIVVDCGTMFPDQEILGFNIIIPDFSYLESIRHKLKALVLTHGHEDHIGATPFLLQKLDLPVYATPFTMELIKEKLGEIPPLSKPILKTFRPGEKITIGNFKIESIFVNHSIIDAAAIAIATPSGYVLHLTDWKIDKTPLNDKVIDLKKFERLGKEGVVLLLGDSTNASHEGATLSETEVNKQLLKICSNHKGRIIVALFSSNIRRVQGLANIAKKLGRTLALVGRSMRENTIIARQLGELNFNGINVLDIEDTKNLPPHKVMVLATGTQGEPRSVLSRMAAGEFRPFQVGTGDLVLFSSKVIPGNEINTGHVVNNLCRRGAKVINESFHDIHASGHAHQNEIKHIFKLTKPKHFVPIHGDYRFLVKHAEFAEKCGIKKKNIFVIDNGQSLHLKKGEMSLGATVSVGRDFVDSDGIGDVSDILVRDRKHLAQTGIVVCVIMIDHTTGELVKGPELIHKGFLEEQGNKILFDKAKKAVLTHINELGLETKTDLIQIQEEVRISLRRFFRKNLDRKPVVIPIIQEV